jgi:hypothetical protein
MRLSSWICGRRWLRKWELKKKGRRRRTTKSRREVYIKLTDVANN